MPLCCSFLGKVPPIGGFCVLYGFLPPTLLRGGERLLCTVGILRKIFRYSDDFTYDFGTYTSGSTYYSIPQLEPGKHELTFRPYRLSLPQRTGWC